MFWQRPVFMLALADIAVVLAGLLFSYIGWQTFTHNGLPQVRQVNVHGITPNMESLKVEAILHRELVSGYFGVDIEHLASEIATISFVRRARVVRSTSLSFDIYIEPHAPVAFWQNNVANFPQLTRREVLVNGRAELFTSESEFNEDLPTLSMSPTGDDLQDRLFLEALVHRLAKWQSWMNNNNHGNSIEKISKMNITAGLMWEVELEEKTRVNLGAWRARPQTTKVATFIDDTLDSLAAPRERLSLEDLAVIDERMHRFLLALPTLKKEYGHNPLIVDMRYPSGMAVKVMH